MTSTPSPHLRHLRAVVYAKVLLLAAATVAGSFVDKDWDGGPALLESTQFLGLEAFGLLLASMTVGPLTAVFPRIPWRGRLQLARRALGVSAFLLAGLHAMLYLVPALLRDWRELLDPGWSWTVGLGLGATAGTLLLALAVTSRDAAVRSMGGRRWKRLHRLVYLALPLVFAHAVLVGSDFALRPALREVEGDAGCLVGFGIATTIWLTMFVMRARARRRGTASAGD
jgi:sulfoxide reductase heme-binding subunit YedZ